MNSNSPLPAAGQPITINGELVDPAWFRFFMQTLQAPTPPAPVEGTVISKTTDYTLLAADSGNTFDNNGATAKIAFTLPAWAANLKFCFSVAAAQTVEVIAAGTDKVAIAPANSVAGGNITSGRPSTNPPSISLLASLCLYASSVNGQWVASSMTGTWTVN